MQMYGIARFSNWLQIRQPDVHLLNEATIERFAVDPKAETIS
jgi:hypothetical protein